MIEFKHVTYSYTAGKPVLKDVSFHINGGERVGLIGANGAGKSTILKAIAGLIDIGRSGEIWVSGLLMGRDDLSEIRRRAGFVLQESDDQMFMPTVLEDMIFGPVNYGMSPAEAEAAADQGHVKVKVVDSVFVRRLGAGVVFRQTPKAGAEVKRGRSIFLTINSIVPKKTTMPNLIGYSFLEAMAELSNRGLNLEKITYTSDMATNNVLRQRCQGRDIRPGAQIVSGSDIELVLGLSRENSRTTVPKVIGMKYIRTVDALHERYLNVGRVHFDPEIRSYRDSVNAFVYKQDAAGSAKTLGSSVNLYLTLDDSKLPSR